MAEPDGADDQLEDPEAEDDVVELVAFEATEHGEPVATEDSRANEGVGEVIGEGHLAD